MPQLFSRKFHAYIDYPVALGLLLMPLLLGFGSAAALLSVLTGIAALLLTAVTDHETGVVKLLPYNVHLAVDAIVGLAFLIAPFALGFTGLTMAYFVVVGATVIAVVSMHRPETATLTPAE